ncbi:hypothetical protein BSL78_27307 [Apostichopus japonicus]|uniref:Uncharacterized protein n=1 Tax=Stichopus japonicus TaxID=307972 RepID=A0A2G8JJE2_STIJA|nr:hypothetical protein BSL78_27307 [Apostichopus japonicus]
MKSGRFLQILLVSLLQTLLRNSKISASGSEVTSSISKEPVKATKPDEMELCEEGIRYPTTIKPDGLVSLSSIHLYQDVKSSNNGPSLLGKLAVTTISVLVVLFCVLGIRWYYKSKTDEEIRPKNGEDERMIVYKTQPTWCNDPDTDSDVNELEPFYCHDSDR